MSESQTAVSYGRVLRNGKVVGYATYQVSGRKIELINLPDRLQVLVDGVEVKPDFVHVMVWTKVAGWLGTADTLKALKN